MTDPYDEKIYLKGPANSPLLQPPSAHMILNGWEWWLHTVTQDADLITAEYRRYPAPDPFAQIQALHDAAIANVASYWEMRDDGPGAPPDVKWTLDEEIVFGPNRKVRISSSEWMDNIP